jgi:hypothetical protein
MGGNPCLEQTLESYELCCLVETFPANHESLEEYKETLKVRTPGARRQDGVRPTLCCVLCVCLAVRVLVCKDSDAGTHTLARDKPCVVA